MDTTKLNTMFVTELFLLLSIMKIATSMQTGYNQLMGDQTVYSHPSYLKAPQPVYYVQPNQAPQLWYYNANNGLTPESAVLGDYNNKQYQLMLSNMIQQQLLSSIQQQYPKYTKDPQSLLNVLSQPVISIPTYMVRVSKMYVPYQQQKQNAQQDYFRPTIQYKQAGRTGELQHGPIRSSAAAKTIPQIIPMAPYTPVIKYGNAADFGRNDELPNPGNIEDIIQRQIRNSSNSAKFHPSSPFLENSTTSTSGKSKFKTSPKNDSMSQTTSNNIGESSDEESFTSEQQLLDRLRNLFDRQYSNAENVEEKSNIGNSTNLPSPSEVKSGNVKPTQQTQEKISSKSGKSIIDQRMKGSSMANSNNPYKKWTNHYVKEVADGRKFSLPIPTDYNTDHLKYSSSKQRQQTLRTIAE